MAETGWLTFEMFSGRVGETFHASTTDGTTIRTELVEASQTGLSGGTGPEGQQRLQFSLVFRGPRDPVLPQATHVLQHAELGSLDVFLVPIGPDEQGMRYEAVFA